MAATAIIFNESLFEISPLVREPLVSRIIKVKGCINIFYAASNPCERIVRFPTATGASDTLNPIPSIVVKHLGFEDSHITQWEDAPI